MIQRYRYYVLQAFRVLGTASQLLSTRDLSTDCSLIEGSFMLSIV